MAASLNNISGFSLIEVVVTVIVVGTVASLTLPNYLRTLERSKSAEGVELLTSLRQAQLAYRLENFAFSDTIAALNITIPTPKHFDAVGDTAINTSNPIAQVVRLGSLYTLQITDAGVISCTPAGANCQKAGF